MQAGAVVISEVYLLLKEERVGFRHITLGAQTDLSLHVTSSAILGGTSEVLSPSFGKTRTIVWPQDLLYNTMA